MARIAFLLLCHRDPDGVIAQARALTAAGDAVAIHLDASAPDEAFDAIAGALGANPDVAIADRVRCGWGEWSLVQATLNAARAALDAFPDATHLYMVSGDCRPIASAARAHAELDARDVDRIESVDFFTSGWIRTGPVEERLIYRHWFNERSQRRLFYLSLEWQQRLRLRRRVPEGLEMRIGSQWWCLRRATVERLLAFCRERPDVIRFFRTTWIPDETFFQTLVAHLVPRDEIETASPTFLSFTDYGMPTTFHDDHHDLLIAQPQLFARKIAPGARRLRDRLDALWASGGMERPDGADGRRLIAFLTERGRHGRRFGPRIWEAGATMGAGRHLVIVVCRDRSAGRTVAEAIAAEGGMPALGYVFQDREAGMPDLGGIGNRLDKRTRHRRVVLRMLFDRLGSDRLALCTEPHDLDLLWDVQADRGETRILLLERAPCPADLRAEAIAAGLLGSDSTEAAAASILPALAERAGEETRRVAEAALPGLVCLPEDATGEEVLSALRTVLACDAATAAAVGRAAGLPVPPAG